MLGKVASLAVALALAAHTASASPLPVIFFHGMTGNHTNGYEIEANLTAEGRAYKALDFCEGACSVSTSLPDQIQMAIKQIRGIVSSDARFSKGYHFMGHSTGGSIARGVVEEMDDHKVHSLISLSGDGNGNFYGPQASDQAYPLQVMVQLLGPYAITSQDFDFGKYSDPSTWKGKFQRDFSEFVSTRPDLQSKNALVNSWIVPVAGANSAWIKTSAFYPKVNNLEECGYNTTCTSEQQRRKTNFLRLKAAHFFASPQDDLQSPWQTAILSKYSEVASIDEIETQFSSLTMTPMADTVEYKNDLYGLKTLDKAGGLHLHTVPNVGHDCWLFDYVPLGKNETCLHAPLYNQYIYPLLV
ncbi:Lysosomal thioesterase ppt2-b, partial [Globisporangium splendens]